MGSVSSLDTLPGGCKSGLFEFLEPSVGNRMQEVSENVEGINSSFERLAVSSPGVKNSKSAMRDDMVTPGKARRVFLESTHSLECCICLDDSQGPEVVLICCGASLHASCVFSWLLTNPSCPACRAPVNFKAPGPVDFEESAPSEFRTAREMLQGHQQGADAQ